LEPGNPDKVENAISELFEDSELRVQLSENAREYVVSNLTWEQRTEKVIQVYDKVLSND